MTPETKSFEEAYPNYKSIKQLAETIRNNYSIPVIAETFDTETIGKVIGYADVECCVCHEVIKTVPGENGMISHGFHEACFESFYAQEIADGIIGGFTDGIRKA
jgi:hypothetical protein